MEYKELMELRRELSGMSDAELCYKARHLKHSDECPNGGMTPEEMIYGEDENQNRNDLCRCNVPKYMVTEEEEARRLEEIREIKRIILVRKERLIRNAVSHYRSAAERSSSVDENDFFQVASMGLLEAMEKYEGGMNRSFDA